MFLIYWYTSKTQLQESQLSQYDRVSSLPCFLQCNTVTFYITSLHVRPHGFLHNTSHELFPTDHMLGIFSQLSQDLYFVSNWCMIGMSHDPHGKSHMNDMYCRMTFTWSTYCVQLYLDPNVKDIVTQDQVSDLSVCHMWYDVSSNCHMVDSLYSMISMECHTCLYCCLSRSHYDRMIHCWPSNSGPFVYVGYGRSDTAGVSWRSTWMSCWTWCRWSGSGC